MQLDMHYYGVYALARAAGMKPKSARIVAQASQFVDDALNDKMIYLDSDVAVLPLPTSHKPLDYANTIAAEQWKVWIPFHFLPGNDPDSATFTERLVCRKNSSLAKKICTFAVEEGNGRHGLHLLGVVSHVFADTFSHHGFVGLNREWNKIINKTLRATNLEKESSVYRYVMAKLDEFRARGIGTLAEILPVGHGSVATFPDRPYLKWEYKPEDGRPLIQRDNPKDYLDGCRELHKLFRRFLARHPEHQSPAGAVGWQKIRGTVAQLLAVQGSKEVRIEAWKKAIAKKELFPTKRSDNQLNYNPKMWSANRIREAFFNGTPLGRFDGSLFVQAAWKYQNHVIHDLMPGMGLFL